MWPFNRNKDSEPSVPAELSNYYQAERQHQNARIWALGFLTLLATIAIVYGLFLGGQWLVGKFQGGDTSDAPTIAQRDDTDPQAATNDKPAADEPDGTASTGNTNGDTSGQSDASGEAGKTSSATTTLPSTGPTETLAVFIAVTILATVAHRLAIAKA